MTTITGSSAATAPLTLISAVSAAHRSIMSTTMRGRLVPALAISCWPAHAVTPVASRPSLTTESEAMKITVGSPKPAKAWLMSRMSVAQSATAAPTATNATGTRLEMKSTTTAPRITKVMALCDTRATATPP